MTHARLGLWSGAGALPLLLALLLAAALPAFSGEPPAGYDPPPTTVPGEPGGSDADYGELELRVTGAQGGGLAGVPLDLVPEGEPDPWCRVQRVRTGPDGTLLVRRIRAGVVRAFYARRQVDGATSSVARVPGGGRVRLVIPIQDDHAFDVLVLGPGETPRAGVGVWLGLEADLGGPPDLVTGADGLVRLAPAEHERFTAFDPELGLSELAAYPFMTGMGPHRIWLRPCLPVGRVSGVLRDAAGAPVAGARVRLGDDHPSFGGLAPVPWAPGEPRSVPAPYGDDGRRVTPLRYARTDAQGRFLLERVPVGQHPGGVRAPGFAPGAFTVRVTAGATAELSLSVARGGAVAGTVRDAAGRAVAGVTVQSVAGGYVWNARPRDDYNAVTTGPDGAFRLENLPLGAQELRAWRREGGEARAEVRVRAEQPGTWDPVLR